VHAPTIQPESYRCDIAWARPLVLVVRYAGRVPADDAHVWRTEEMLLRGAPIAALCFDVGDMVSFHHRQVSLHAKMLGRVGSRVAAIALVGARPAARFGAVTVSLMAKLPLQCFDARGPAIAWLESQVGLAMPA
jgi:hypothetical protein